MFFIMEFFIVPRREFCKLKPEQIPDENLSQDEKNKFYVMHSRDGLGRVSLQTEELVNLATNFFPETVMNFAKPKFYTYKMVKSALIADGMNIRFVFENLEKIPDYEIRRAIQVRIEYLVDIALESTKFAYMYLPDIYKTESRTLLAIKTHTFLMKYVPETRLSNNVFITLLTTEPTAIYFIKNPTFEQCKFALDRNIDSARFIHLTYFSKLKMTKLEFETICNRMIYYNPILLKNIDKECQTFNLVRLAYSLDKRSAQFSNYIFKQKIDMKKTNSGIK